MCSCCCRKKRNAKGCFTWMVHSSLANLLSLVNLLNFLLSTLLIVYGVYILKLKSYHLDVPAIVLLYTGGISFIFSFLFICGLRNKYYLMTYVFHTFTVVLIQSSTYLLYMNHEWHRWIGSHLLLAPHWAAVILRHHVKTTKLVLAGSFITEIVLLILSVIIVCYCDSREIYRQPGDYYDVDDDGYFDDDIDVNPEEVSTLLAEEEERSYRQNMDRRRNNYTQKRDDIFRKYKYYDNNDNGSQLQW